jgi:hypothetical protein
LRNGGCSGYIGNAERTFQSDLLLQQVWHPHLSWDVIAIWICSSDARHFANSMSEDSVELMHYLRKMTHQVYNKVMVWEDPTHTGFLASSMRLMTEYEEKGMLMPPYID